MKKDILFVILLFTILTSILIGAVVGEVVQGSEGQATLLTPGAPATGVGNNTTLDTPFRPPANGGFVGPQRPGLQRPEGPGGGWRGAVGEDLRGAGEALRSGDRQRAGVWLIAAGEDLLVSGEDLRSGGNDVDSVDMKKTGIPSMYIAIILILLSIVTLIIHKKK